MCRGGCRCDLIAHVRRRRKGHGLEWLEADMGFNESPLLSFSQHSVFEPGVGEADKGNGTKLCVADMSTGYLHLKPRHTLLPVPGVYRA